MPLVLRRAARRPARLGFGLVASLMDSERRKLRRFEGERRHLLHSHGLLLAGIYVGHLLTQRLLQPARTAFDGPSFQRRSPNNRSIRPLVGCFNRTWFT